MEKRVLLLLLLQCGALLTGVLHFMRANLGVSYYQVADTNSTTIPTAPSSSVAVYAPAVQHSSATALSHAIRLSNSGADPWITRDGEYLYYLQTTGTSISIWRSNALAQILHTQSHTVYDGRSAPTEASRNIWAPELHHIDGRWYIYFAADDGRNENHRMFVLEAERPLGPYTFRGILTPPDGDYWAIDGHPFNFRDQRYFIWSGWPGRHNGQQNIYIARMDSPVHISSARQAIASPRYSWESWINEAPQALVSNDRLLIVYSANQSWTDDYRLGMLMLTGEDPLDASAWHKLDKPVFDSVLDATAPIIAPGHCAFYYEAQSAAHWILYHVAQKRGAGWSREVRAQQWSFDSKGLPFFDKPRPLIEFNGAGHSELQLPVDTPAPMQDQKQVAFRGTTPPWSYT